MPYKLSLSVLTAILLISPLVSCRDYNKPNGEPTKYCLENPEDQNCYEHILCKAGWPSQSNNYMPPPPPPPPPSTQPSAPPARKTCDPGVNCTVVEVHSFDLVVEEVVEVAAPAAQTCDPGMNCTVVVVQPFDTVVLEVTEAAGGAAPVGRDISTTDDRPVSKVSRYLLCSQLSNLSETDM